MGAAPHLVQRRHGISRPDRRACHRLLATPSVTSVQIEHAVLLVVLLGRHISRRVGVVVDPPTISFFPSLFSFYLFFPRFVRWSYSTLFFILYSHCQVAIVVSSNRHRRSADAAQPLASGARGKIRTPRLDLSRSAHSTQPNMPFLAGFVVCGFFAGIIRLSGQTTTNKPTNKKTAGAV